MGLMRGIDWSASDLPLDSLTNLPIWLAWSCTLRWEAEITGRAAIADTFTAVQGETKRKRIAQAMIACADELTSGKSDSGGMGGDVGQGVGVGMSTRSSVGMHDDAMGDVWFWCSVVLRSEELTADMAFLHARSHMCANVR